MNRVILAITCAASPVMVGFDRSAAGVAFTSVAQTCRESQAPLTQH